MSDNVTADPGAGGATFATDDDGTAHHPYVKLEWGADNTQTKVAAGANALPIQDGGNSITVDGTVGVSGTVAVDASGTTVPVSNAGLTELAAAINASSQVDVNIAASGATVPVSNAGLTELAAAINGSSQMDVNIAASGATVPVSNAGLTALNGAISGTEVQVDVLTLPNVTLAAGTNTNEVVGDAAHGAAVAGNPVLIGIEGRSTAPTAVDSGDVVRPLATLLGKQVVYQYAIPAETWSYASPAAVTDTADDEAKAAGGAGVRHYITGVQVFNADDTVGTEVVIKDGSTVLWRGWCEQTGGGAAARFDPPLRGTANTAVNVANITTSAETYFNLQGFSASE